jgi:DNA primase
MDVRPFLSTVRLHIMPGRIPPDIVDRIREATDIVDLISEYVQLKRKGVNYFGLCPFHSEKTPSFSVHPGKQIFHCFGCGIGGNVFTFLQEHDKLSFVEAARELAKRAGISIPDDRTSPAQTEQFDRLYRANEFALDFFVRSLWEAKGEEFDNVRRYLQGRSISLDLAKSFRVGYAPDRWDGLTNEIRRVKPPGLQPRDFLEAGLLQRKDDRLYDRFRGRLMFPIMNLSGRPVGFGGRILKDAAEAAKYINTQQTPIYNKSRQLFGVHLAREAIRRKGMCLLVEGYTDLMRLHENGFIHSVATSGTALTEEQARLLRRFCLKVVLVFDGDTAGSHAALRGGDVLLGAGLEVLVAALPRGSDPDTFILKNGAGAFGELLEKARDLITYRVELYRREGRLTDVPSRSEVARELISSLAAIPDSIRREMTTQEAARQIGVETQTLLRELARYRSPAYRSADGGAETKDPYASLPVKERGLVEVLIRRPELREPVFEAINPDDLHHPMLRRIAAAMETAEREGKDPSGVELISDETPREDAGFISYALSQTESFSEPGIDPKAKRRYDDFITAQDCLRDLITSRLNRQEEELKVSLRSTADLKQSLAIQKKIKQIIEKKKQLHSRRFFDIPPHPSTEIPEDQIQSAAERAAKGR